MGVGTDYDYSLSLGKLHVSLQRTCDQYGQVLSYFIGSFYHFVLYLSCPHLIYDHYSLDLKNFIRLIDCLSSLFHHNFYSLLIINFILLFILIDEISSSVLLHIDLFLVIIILVKLSPRIVWGAGYLEK